MAAEFSDAVAEGQWTLVVEDVAGNAALDDDALGATFTPTEPLAWSSAYHVEARACDDELRTTFSTVPEPVPLDVLDGRTYRMPYDELVWVEPAVAVILHPFVEFESFLMEVFDPDPAAASFQTAFTAGWADDVPECGSVITTEGNYEANPHFATGSADLIIPVNQANPPFEVLVEDVSLQGTFLPPGDRIADVVIRGRVHTASLDAALDVGVPVCQLAKGLGDTCTACADGQVKCLDAVIEAGPATWTPTPGILSVCGL